MIITDGQLHIWIIYCVTWVMSQLLQKVTPFNSFFSSSFSSNILHATRYMITESQSL